MVMARQSPFNGTGGPASKPLHTPQRDYPYPMTIGPQKLRPYWLIGATTFSRIGTLAYTVVMTWAVSKAGGNNSVGWVNAAAGFAIVLVGISAAFWLDKFDKRTMLLLLDAAAATVCLAAAVLCLVPMSSVVFTGMVVAIVTSAVASLYSPASRALIPSMVPAEGLERYNSVYTGFSETSRAAGPGLGALLLAVGGSEAFPLSLTINSISFIISFLLTLPLPPDPPRQANEHKQKERTFFQSVRVITKHSILRGEVLGALSINFLLPSNTFILLNRIAETGAKASIFGLANFFEAAGAVTAALTAAIIAVQLRRIRASQLMAPIALALLLCLTDGIWATIISLTVVTALVTVYNIILFSQLQRKISREKMGSVIAVVTTSSAAVMPLGNLVFSKLSTTIPTHMLIWATTITLLAAGLAITIGNRKRGG